MQDFAAEHFTTNPNPLEVVGDNVPGTVTANVPQKFFKKNAEVTVTPYLSYGMDNKATSQSYTFQGEKVKGNNPVINYKEGGTVTIPVNFVYTPEMMKSDLYLDFNVVQGKKVYTLPAVKVGEGVVATSTLADATTVTPSAAADKYQRVINEICDANLMFLINQANVRASELKKGTSVSNFNETVAEASKADNKEIEGIHVSSFASPEGGVKFNAKLSEKREHSTVNYLNKNLKKEKVDNYGDITSEFTAQDWDGFQKLVSESNIQDKDLILSVLSMYSDPEQREKEIRNLSSVFNELADQILPQLRYSRIQATVKVLGRTDRELVEQFNTDPTKLSVDEMLYLATLTDDNFKKMEVYDRIARIYPKESRAYVNLGATQLVAGDKDGAKANFEEALRLDPNSKPAEMNLALIAMMNGDNSRANELLGAAAGTPGIDDALGVYYLQTGDVANAVRAFGDSKTNNAAVAQILNRDYAGAQRTLQSVAKPDAITYYLMAVTGARTGNQQQVMDNLRQAVKLDRKLLDRAKSDLEFANYNLTYL